MATTLVSTTVTNTLVQKQQEFKQSAAVTPSKSRKLYEQFTHCFKRDIDFLASLALEFDKIKDIFSDSSRKEHEALKNGTHKFSILGELFIAKAEGEDIHIACVGKQLGQGGYTTVYEAILLSTKTDAAAQVVFKKVKDIRNDESTLKIAQVQMQNAIQIKKILPQDSLFANKHFVVFGNSYTEARCSLDLFDRITVQKATATPQLRVNWARQYFTAVQTMHKHGVVHRDLKAENVLLDSTTGQLSLTDWGTAITATSEPDKEGNYCGLKIQKKMYEWFTTSTDKDYFDRQKGIDLIVCLNDAYVVMMGEYFIDNRWIELVKDGKKIKFLVYTSQEQLSNKIDRLANKYSKETADVFKKYFLCNGIPDLSNLAKDMESIGVLEQEQKIKQSQSTSSAGA